MQCFILAQHIFFIFSSLHVHIFPFYSLKIIFKPSIYVDLCLTILYMHVFYSSYFFFPLSYILPSLIIPTLLINIIPFPGLWYLVLFCDSL